MIHPARKKIASNFNLSAAQVAENIRENIVVKRVIRDLFTARPLLGRG
jgi:hypothetical protein